MNKKIQIFYILITVIILLEFKFLIIDNYKLTSLLNFIVFGYLN